MKRAIRRYVQLLVHAGHKLQDVLDSDARQRATIRDLKARLKQLRQRGPHLGTMLPDEFWRLLDLRNKKWRLP